MILTVLLMRLQEYIISGAALKEGRKMLCGNYTAKIQKIYFYHFYELMGLEWECIKKNESLGKH